MRLRIIYNRDDLTVKEVIRMLGYGPGGEYDPMDDDDGLNGGCVFGDEDDDDFIDDEDALSDEDDALDEADGDVTVIEDDADIEIDDLAEEDEPEAARQPGAWLALGNIWFNQSGVPIG